MLAKCNLPVACDLSFELNGTRPFKGRVLICSPHLHPPRHPAPPPVIPAPAFAGAGFSGDLTPILASRNDLQKYQGLVVDGKAMPSMLTRAPAKRQAPPRCPNTRKQPCAVDHAL